MEDILSSIKRIIAEEGDSAVTARSRRMPRPAVPSQSATARDRTPVHDIDPAEVLELSDRVVDDEDVVEKPMAKRDDARIPTDSILSETAAEASRGALDSLSRLVVKPAAAPEASPVGETLEGLVREMLRPMLRDWLDAKLPGMVEAMVAKEIARITQGR